MNNILLNSSKYKELAKRFEFDKNKWDKEKVQCLLSLLTAIETFSKCRGYSIELSAGKEPCLNINPDSQNGRIRGRTAGIYVVPTKAMTRFVLNENTYFQLRNQYELPNCKLKKNQYHCSLTFCELCSFIEAIISL